MSQDAAVFQAVATCKARVRKESWRLRRASGGPWAVRRASRIFGGFALFLSLIVALAGEVGTGNSLNITEWIRCVSPKGGFSVLMPGRPKASVKTEFRSGIEVESHQLSVEIAPSTGFMVIYTDFPASFARVPVAALLDGAQTNALGKAGRLISSRDGTMGGRPTRELHLARPDLDRVIDVKLILDQQRLFHLMVSTKPEIEVSPEVSFFYNSFEFDAK